MTDLLRALVLVLISTPLAAPSASAAGLNVGDKAPPLTIAHWARGGPIDMAKGVEKEAYLLEFWATWCGPCIQGIPHMDDLHKRFKDKGLKIIGISDEERDVVKKFLDKRSDSMIYNVAVDDGGKTTRSYMLGVGMNGIPYSFVVDKKGLVAWHGSPYDDELGSVLEEVLAGKYDAVKKGKISGLWDKAAAAHRQQKFDDALTTLNEILALDPAHEMAMRNSLLVIQREFKDRQKMRSWTQSYLDKNGASADGQAALASSLMAIEPLADRDPDLIVRAAKGAYNASNKSDAAFIELYAEALYSVGKIDEAIRIQSEALKVSSDADRPARQKTLEFYYACKAVPVGE